MAKSGLDVLLSEHIAELSDARIGVVANQASVTSGLVHIADALHAAGVKIAALFGPEHGARGDVADGKLITDAFDNRLGVPVFSLYGEAKEPTQEMLEKIDIMLLDLQDVGARFYTFASTLSLVMSACGKRGIPVWILDRPNPISGLDADGPVLEPEFSSFIGMHPIPTRHALTLGELAMLFKAVFGVDCELRVIHAQDWSRGMWFDETGLPWVPPSPNMPTLDTATVYSGMCLIEGTNVSVGRGTTRPFEMFGSPWIDPFVLKAELVHGDLPGVAFREAYFTPTAAKFQGNHCAGLQVYVTDRCAFRPVVTGVAVVSALRKLFPDHFAFRDPGPDGRRSFDLLTGTASAREAIEAGMLPWDIADMWNAGLSDFAEVAGEILLY